MVVGLDGRSEPALIDPMDDTGTTPAPAAPPVTDDAIAAAFMDAIEDLLDLDEREVMALRAREAEAAKGNPGP